MKNRSVRAVMPRKIFSRAIYITIVTMVLSGSLSSANATEACAALARRMGHSVASFPTVNLNSLRQIIVWRASHCEEPPRSGAGNIAIMCEVETFDRHSILFWERNNKGQFNRGFLSCPLRY